MGSMLPYIAAPWILWVGEHHFLVGVIGCYIMDVRLSLWKNHEKSMV